MHNFFFMLYTGSCQKDKYGLSKMTIFKLITLRFQNQWPLQSISSNSISVGIRELKYRKQMGHWDTSN